jgi:hypothetical protein
MTNINIFLKKRFNRMATDVGSQAAGLYEHGVRLGETFAILFFVALTFPM